MSGYVRGPDLHRYHPHISANLISICSGIFWFIKFLSVSRVLSPSDSIRNATIAQCFFKGKATRQQYAWLEANLVFEVARLLARVDVPTLIVRDEFVVPVDMVKAVHEISDTTGFEGLG